MNNKSFLKQIWGFLKERKAWWLIPLIIILIIAGLLIYIGQSSAISPFIYTLV
ncbi:MAG: DUF5989 family protein [Candidatus Pacearchaeota archaeon]